LQKKTTTERMTTRSSRPTTADKAAKPTSTMARETVLAKANHAVKNLEHKVQVKSYPMNCD